MWFKNLSLFRLLEPFAFDAVELEVALKRHPWRPCSSQEWSAQGWTPPLGARAQTLVHAVNGRALICLKSEERILPPAVIREAVTAKLADLEERERRPVRRAERAMLREEVIQELLPKAFTRSRYDYAYLDPHGRWLVVDGASRRAVENVTGWLRKSLGSLPIAPLRTHSAPALVMTNWLMTGELPNDFAPGEECELRDSADEAAIVRCQGQDMLGEEIQTHLQAGKQITRLALQWDEHLSLVLSEDLTIRRLRFLDVVQERVKAEELDSFAAVFDAQFVLMNEELARFLPRLLAIFDGEANA